MIKLEKRQVPTVALVSEPFMEDARFSIEADGMPLLPMARLDVNCLTNLSPEQIRSAVEPHIHDVIKGITTPVSKVAEQEKCVEEDFEIFNGSNGLSAWEAMNMAFLEYGWSDGFPLVPPTEEKVNEMLKTTKRDPGEVIGMLVPGNGLATVRKIAINAVMAGCLPEHRPLPILIAALKACMDPKALYRVIAMSTGPHAPMMVINGPIRKEIGLNCERGALGPGAPSFTNIVLGRALRLIMMNIGHTYLGVTDMDTIGSPNKYSMCLGENEEKNPWEPYHVEMGYNLQDSTVTLFGVESQLEILDFKNYTPEGILMSYAGTINTVGALANRGWIYPERNCDNCVLLCPDHAKVIDDHGWSKEDIQQFLYQNATIAARFVRNTVEESRTRPGVKWIWAVDDDYPLPIAGAYDWFRVVVVGGPAGKSSYTTGVGKAVTVKIED